MLPHPQPVVESKVAGAFGLPVTRAYPFGAAPAHKLKGVEIEGNLPADFPKFDFHKRYGSRWSKTIGCGVGGPSVTPAVTRKRWNDRGGKLAPSREILPLGAQFDFHKFPGAAWEVHAQVSAQSKTVIPGG